MNSSSTQHYQNLGIRYTNLCEIAWKVLIANGWLVERINGVPKACAMRITKDGVNINAAIRTGQNKMITFTRRIDSEKWKTLDEDEWVVNAVVTATVDDKDDQQNAYVYLIDGDYVRSRFNAAYDNWKKKEAQAGKQIPMNGEKNISLHIEEILESYSHGHVGPTLMLKEIVPLPSTYP